MPSESNASSVARESGYSAPYLYLLDDESTPSTSRGLSQFSERSLNRVSSAIRSGAGQGHGESYQPWLRIRRNFSSPVSYQVFKSVSIHKRNHHFLSELEFHTALISAYLGAKGLRECLPMWPIEHPHPAKHLNGSQYGTAPGLFDIAKELGIDHGSFVGTTVPYIGSVDLMLNWETTASSLAGISCKPGPIVATSVRAQERIALDRAYCKAIGAHHHHETGDSINLQLVRNLSWLHPLPTETALYEESQQFADYVCVYNECSSERPIRDAVGAAARAASVLDDDPYRFWRLGIWKQKIDIDLTQRVHTPNMMHRANHTLLADLRKKFFGVSNG